MLTNTLMLVRSHPQDMAREDEFNEWYTGNHVPDVLHAPGLKAALRYKLAVTQIGEVPPYLALYYIDNDDATDANNGMMAYLNAPDAKRMVMPAATGQGEDWEIHGEGGGTRPGGLISVDTWAYYTKTLEVGENDVSPENAAKGLLVTYTAPAADADVDALNKWYDWHMDDIVTTPGIRGGTRYKLASLNAGAATEFAGIFEFDTDDVEKVAADLGQTLATAPSGGIPTTESGVPALDIFGFAFYKLESAPTKVHTLLP